MAHQGLKEGIDVKIMVFKVPAFITKLLGVFARRKRT
jgi:hypothetical protein